MAAIAGDFCHALKLFRKSPGFAAAAVLTLALGIGANSAIFSVLDAVLLRPLPYPGAGRLVMLWEARNVNPNQFADPKAVRLSRTWWPDDTVFARWGRSQSFEAMAGFGTRTVRLTGAGEPERLNAAAVTSGFFDLTGARPLLGRAFLPEEDRFGNDHVAVLTYRLWMRRFGGSPGVLGSKILLDGNPHAVVGILPAGFDLALLNAGQETQLLVPIGHLMNAKYKFAIFQAAGRLKTGVAAARAQEELAALTRGLVAESPRRYREITGVNLVPVVQEMSKEVSPALRVLLGAAGCVLLIACANLANLLLARAMGKRRELGIRAVLGAGRWPLVRQSLAESLTLALAGGALGMLLAHWGVGLLVAAAPQGMIPRTGEIGVDGRVLAFGLTVSVVTGLVIGLIPAWQALRSRARGELHEALKEGGRSSAGGRGRPIRSLLVVAEMAAALVVLAGAGLLARSFVRLTGVDPGFRPENVLTVQLALPVSKYQNSAAQAAFAAQLLERARTLPAVESVAMTNTLPIVDGPTWSGNVAIEGRPKDTPDAQVFLRSVSAGYFQTMGMALRWGRLFSAGDSSTGAAIVNEAMVRRYWPDWQPGSAAPLGSRIQFDKWREIVGVISDIKHNGLGEDTNPEVYFLFDTFATPAMTLVVRAAGNPQRLVPAVRNAVWAVDRDQPLDRIQTLEQVLYRSVAAPRFRLALLGIFAFLALALSAVGIYGVIAYAVTERTREIGIRMALGAERMDVLQMVLREGLTLAAVGVGVGVAGAVAATRVLTSFLFGVAATDPWTLGGVSLALMLVAAAASYVPARRAIRVDPMIALRWE